MTKSLHIALLTAAVIALSSQAQADQVTFVFNCEITPHVPGTSCVAGGPYGTLTLTDSIIDTNRVDIDLTITPPNTFGQPLEQFYLNFINDTLTNHKFYLVTQNAQVGVASNTPYLAGELLGSVGFGNDTFDEPGNQFKFDVNPDPTSGAQTFHGSLSLYSQLPNPDVPVNLDVSMFLTSSEGTSLPHLLAAYRTSNSTCTGATGTCGEFWAGSTSVATPEPSSLLFLGTILASVGVVMRRARPGLQR